jgi:hypothetical protein
VLASLETSQFATLIRTEVWGWPLALTVHAFGSALVIGFIIIIGLRLLGLFETIPYTSLTRFFPVIWAAVVVQFLSGFVLFAAKPTQYAGDGAFVLKVLLMIVGIILTISFQSAIKREAAAWEAKGTVSSGTIQFVAADLLVWCSVLVVGRLTAYLGSINFG